MYLIQKMNNEIVQIVSYSFEIICCYLFFKMIVRLDNLVVEKYLKERGEKLYFNFGEERIFFFFFLRILNCGEEWSRPVRHQRDEKNIIDSRH